MIGKDLLTLAELSPSDLDAILKLAEKLKETRSKGTQSVLKGKSLAMVFQKNSTRTRVSFEVGMRELGGDAISLSEDELQLGRGETIEDTAGVLSRFVHIIMARVRGHDDVVRLAEAATVPVINGLSDAYHPVQILADLMTLVEKKGRLEGLKVAWIGDGDNVCNSWLYGAALSGINLVVASPEGYGPRREAINGAGRMTKSTEGRIRIIRDPVQAARDADCIITDSFVSMGLEKEREKRMKAFMLKYTVDSRIMSYAKKDALFLHCMPVHRGEEVSGGVMDGPQSAVFDEAENRLHTTKALLCFMLLGEKRTLASLGSR